MKTISLKIPENLLLRLDKEARTRRVPRSRVVRESLEAALKKSRTTKQPSAYDLAADLIGTVKGLQKDLATNPKYMVGFGK